MPKSRSLWPSIPRKVTWERSGSFKLASPPASSARADAAPSKDRAAAVAANLANLQVNLQVRDQAFASQVSIPKSSVDYSFRRHSNGIQRHFTGQLLAETADSGTLFRPSVVWRDRRSNCSHSTGKKPPRAGPRLPQIEPAKRPKDGSLGPHKTPIYNILAKAGQTGHCQKTYRFRIASGRPPRRG